MMICWNWAYRFKSATETQRHRDTETRGQGDKETRGQGEGETKGKREYRKAKNHPVPLSPCPLVSFPPPSVWLCGSVALWLRFNSLQLQTSDRARQSPRGACPRRTFAEL